MINKTQERKLKIG